MMLQHTSHTPQGDSGQKKPVPDLIGHGTGFHVLYGQHSQVYAELCIDWRSHIAGLAKQKPADTDRAAVFRLYIRYLAGFL